eukprot:jgi/Tetstr1/424974/TSEL_001508.t1
MDIDAPAWPPAGVEAADEGVIREGDPGDFYMKVIAKKFWGVWHYGVITGVVTEWVFEDYGGATQWRAVFEDGDIVDLLRSEVVEAMAAAQEHPPVDADGEARLVPDTSRYVRHMCPKGCVAFSGAPGKAGGWANLPDQHCPECNADSLSACRMPQSLKLTAARVWYVLSVADIIKGWFRDPVWYACLKKGTDVSINAFRASSEAERLNEGWHGTGLAAGDFLHADNGIYTLTDDGFLSHLRTTQAVTGVGIRCEDMPPHMLTSRSNWHPVALIGPPEPPNLGKILLEVLHELAVLGEHGVRVTPADGGEQFVHKVFLGMWVCDAHGRRKTFVRGGASQLRGCPWCRLVSRVECPDGTMKVAPAGYAKDVLQRVDGVELQAVRTGASCLLLSGDQMLEQMGVIGQIEEDLAKSDLDGDEDGELSPADRRAFNTTRLE